MHIAENRRLKKIPLRQPFPIRWLAADDDFGAFLFPCPAVELDLVELFLERYRAHFRLCLLRVAQFDLRGFIHKFIEQDIDNALVSQKARACDTGLTGRGKYAFDDAIYRVIDISVLEDDIRRLPAQLQSHARMVLGGILGHELSSFG